MADKVWQLRKYYGYNHWTEWEDVVEGITLYSPRTLLNMDLGSFGNLEFRVKPEPTCEVCDNPIVSFGLCTNHLDEAYYEYLEETGWPDFHDDPDNL